MGVTGRAAVRTLALALAIALVTLVAFAASASAQQPVPDLVIGFEEEGVVGDAVALSAYLVDPAGNPIAGERVTFTADREFMNTLGRVALGTVTTDGTGLAMLLYVPKREGEEQITARFAGNQVFAPTEASRAIRVAPGPPTYVEEVPFRVPGASINLVVSVLAVVWSLLLFVVFLFMLIALAGRDGSKGARRSA